MVSDSGPGALGGAETSLERLTEALRDRGHEVLRGYAEAGPAPVPPTDLLFDLPQPQTRFRLPRPGYLINALQGLAQLRRTLKERKPDAVCLHYVTARAGYLLALRPAFGYALLLSARGSDLLRPRPFDRRLLPALLQRADGVVALSEALSHAVEDLTSAPPPPVVYNGVDTEFWSPARSTPPVVPTVISVGRLEHVKGHDVLINAMQPLREAIPDVRLILVGDGSRRQKLVEQVHALGLDRNVVFPGALTQADVRRRLRESTVFCLPSRSEGLSNALLEALSTGVPAVASDVGGIPEVLAGGGGTTVAAEDPHALASALAALIRDADAREQAARAARENACSWSWAAAAESFERAVYQAIDARQAQRDLA